MPIPVDFLQDETGDLDLSLGLRRTPDLATYVRQKLSENLAFFLGEWFLDQRKGVPYFRHVIGERFDHALLETLFRRVAVKTHGVGSVARLSVSFDNAGRGLSVDMAVKTVTGETIDPAVPFLIEVF